MNLNTKKFGGFFDFSKIEESLKVLKNKTIDPNFWLDNKKASLIQKQISFKEKELTVWNNVDTLRSDIGILIEFLVEGSVDEEEVLVEISKYKTLIEEIEIKMILGKKEDKNGAIISIHPGAGGTESQDWAEMLYRMYTRWSEKQGFKLEVLDIQVGDEAGLKDVTFEISGDFAYGLSKAEAGIHRLVRISPFDSNNKRHTSFASVYVYPAIDDQIEINIDLTDLRIDTYRASGAGGQHVNKTDSAVRITHLPSGIVSQCQNERSQLKNKNQAMKILKARLYQAEIEKEKEKNKDLESQKKDIGWGNQIRSYVFHPYNMVKDHRTKKENTNTQLVMDGEINGFIRSYLLQNISKLKG